MAVIWEQWNSLPGYLRNIGDPDLFRSQISTHKKINFGPINEYRVTGNLRPNRPTAARVLLTVGRYLMCCFLCVRMIIQVGLIFKSELR